MKHLITHDSPIPLTKEQINKPKPSTDVKNEAGQRSKDVWRNRMFEYYGYGHKTSYTVTYTSDNQIKHIKYD